MLVLVYDVYVECGWFLVKLRLNCVLILFCFLWKGKYFWFGGVVSVVDEERNWVMGWWWCSCGRLIEVSDVCLVLLVMRMREIKRERERVVGSLCVLYIYMYVFIYIYIDDYVMLWYDMFGFWKVIYMLWW